MSHDLNQISTNQKKIKVKKSCHSAATISGKESITRLTLGHGNSHFNEYPLRNAD